MQVCENDLIEILCPEENDDRNNAKDVYRILYVDNIDKLVWWIHIFDNNLPVCIQLSEIELKLSTGEIELYTELDPWDEYPDTQVFDSDTFELMKKKEKIESIKNDRWDIIKDKVDDEPKIFTKEGRSNYYDCEVRKSKKNAAEYVFTFVLCSESKNKVSRKLFLKLLKQYWKRGKTELSLYPDFSNCGFPKFKSDEVGKKRGPKYQNDPLKGRALTQEDKDYFEVFIKSHIEKKKKTLEKTFDLIIKSRCYKYELDGNGGLIFESNNETGKREAILKSDRDKPSLSQFRNYYYATRNAEQRERNRLGEKSHKLNRRPATGSEKAQYPGDQFQIDATVLDFYVRSHYYPYNLIGQPVFYVIIDVYSRFIIGWYMGLGRPSGQAALMTLVNMATDKRTFLQRIGYVDNEEFMDLDAHFSIKGVPKKLIIDQAELRKSVPKHIQKRFRIHILHTPAKRPDWKGIVERRFGILQNWASMYDPSHGNYHKKKYGDPDVRKEAVKTFDQLYMDFLDLIYLHNHTLIKNPHILTNLTLNDGVMPVPIELYKHGIENIGGCVRNYSEATIRKNFLRTGSATKTRGGIKFRGLYFKPVMDNYESYLMSSKVTQFAKSKPDNELEILFNETIVDRIYLPIEGLISPVECVLLGKCDFEVQAELPEGFLDVATNSIKQITWYEFDDLREEYNQRFRDEKEYSRDLSVYVDNRLTERAEIAKEETEKLTSNMSVNAFLKGAKERKEELKIEQEQQEAQQILNQYTPEQVKPILDEEDDEDFEIDYSQHISAQMKKHSNSNPEEDDE